MKYWLFKNKSIYRLLIALQFTIIFTFNSFVFSHPAIALIRQHHETTDVLRYHVQNSLKDRDGNTWQVILFPDKKNSETATYYLRLVGFPGINSFKHPQSLEILTSEGKILISPDAYRDTAPAPNVGQYDITEIISQLPQKGSLKLSSPLASDRELSLKIPKSVFAEWQLLVKEIEPRN